MTKITYREATYADAEAIVEFQLAMAMETEALRLDRGVCQAGVEGVFLDPARGKYFVAEADDGVIASLLITYEWSDWRNGEIWWIQSVYVLPTMRKQGVFCGLYHHVRELAIRNVHVRGLRLYVDKRNARAHTVYARLGMNGDHYQVFEWMK